MRERVVVCMRRVNQYKDEVMEQSACPRMSRPATRGRCHTKRCPPVWIKSHWSLVNNLIKVSAFVFLELLNLFSFNRASRPAQGTVNEDAVSK